MDNIFLKAALDYASHGWSVIPLQARDKRPAIKSWRDYQKERADEKQIRKWWKQYPQANVGVITGSVSGIIVLDVDGEEGQASLKNLAKGLLPTPVTNTGNGNHYIFKHPGREIRNFASREPGLDLRGDGGYIVAPPSIHPSGRQYEWALNPDDTPPADMPDWLLELTEKKPTATGGTTERLDPSSILQGVPEGERDWTLFRYASRLRAKGYDRSEAETLVLQAAANCTPPFPEDEALKKVESAWRYDAGDGAEAETVIHTLMDRLDQIDPVEVYEPEVLGALAALKKHEPSEYAKTKQELKQAFKRDINLNDLEKAVNQELAKMQKLRLAEPNEPPPKLEDILPDMPLTELRKPYNWTLNENGIWTETKNGPVCACPVPVLLTKRLHNVDTAEEKVEVAFYRDGNWKYITADRATVFNRTSLVQLTNKGLPVSSESSRHLVRYLSEFESENLNNLPLVRSTSTMGWIGSKTFFPGAEGDMVLDVEQGGGATVAKGYRESGSIEEWFLTVQPIRKYPIARFTLAASFAAPLLKIVGQRVYIIHNWGPSRGGKTASLKAALSVWGEPEEIMASFNATKVGLERLAAFYSDLPLGIDERQVVGDKQGFVESLVYLLGLGKGKARGSKGGGLQQFTTWRTIALTTGEEPLSSESSTAGIRTRALELYGVPIPDEKLASKLHQSFSRNYGLAGPLFIRQLLKELDDDPEIFRTDYEAIFDELTKLGSDNITSHISAVATVCMADYYASQWIFGQDETEAFQEAMNLAKTILGQLETTEEADDGMRAYEHLMSWYQVHKDHFQDNVFGKRFGFLKTGYICFFPSIFDEVLREAKFNPSRIKRDWAERGWIQTSMQNGRKRYVVQQRTPKSGTRAYVISVLINTEAENDT